MSKIRFEFFRGEFDAAAWSYTGDGLLEISLSSDVCGELIIGEQSFEVEDGEVKANLCRTADGIYTPYLYTKGNMFVLPRIKKQGKICELLPFTDEYIAALASRTRIAISRICELEAELASQRKLIEGSRLSIGEQ